MDSGPEEDRLVKTMQRACEEAWEKLHGLVQDEVLVVLERFLHRIHGCTALIMHAQSAWEDRFDYEACILLRPIYDACLQAMYVTEKDGNSLERARDYLCFADIERMRLMEDGRKLNSPFIMKIMAAPNPNTQEAIRERCNAAMQRFQLPSGNGKCPKEWYKCSLNELATRLGYAEEHFVIVKLLNKAIHCSPFATEVGSRGVLDPSMVRFAASHLNCRALDAAISYAGLTLSETTTQLFRHARQDIVKTYQGLT